MTELIIRKREDGVIEIHLNGEVIELIKMVASATHLNTDCGAIILTATSLIRSFIEGVDPEPFNMN